MVPNTPYEKETENIPCFQNPQIWWQIHHTVNTTRNKTYGKQKRQISSCFQHTTIWWRTQRELLPCCQKLMHDDKYTIPTNGNWKSYHASKNTIPEDKYIIRTTWQEILSCVQKIKHDDKNIIQKKQKRKRLPCFQTTQNLITNTSYGKHNGKYYHAYRSSNTITKTLYRSTDTGNLIVLPGTKNQMTIRHLYHTEKKTN